MTCRIVTPYGSSHIDPSDLDRECGVPGLSKLLGALHDHRTSGSCPACGWTLEKANETVSFGCPLCYTVLYPEYLRARAAVPGSPS